MEYKNYDITDTPNEWGYFEATSKVDCDAEMISATSVESIKIEIDERE